MTSFFTLSKYVFFISMTAAQLMFANRNLRRRFFWMRISISLLFSFSIATLFSATQVTAVYCSLIFSVFFFISIPLTRFCFNMEWRNCIFSTLASYSTQHIASILYNLILSMIGYNYTMLMYSNTVVFLDPLILLIFLEVYTIVHVAVYHAFAKKMRKSENVTITRPRLLGILLLVMMVEIILNAFVTYHPMEHSDMVYYTCASLTNMLCSISVLIILFGQLLNKTLEEELTILNQMWRQERKQYKISKDTIDMINIKCHDMKHQLHTIRKAETIDPQALLEIENNINIYDAMVKTGDEALDIILAEKGLLCQKSGITINCMIQGEKLSFMNDMDVYSLFGNLLDNAMNSAMVVEPDKRVINITVKAHNDFLSIIFRNYYTGEICLTNGVPVTRNVDTQNHGFGIKSIRMIVDRYEGNVTYQAENEVFTASILLPIPNKTKVEQK